MPLRKFVVVKSLSCVLLFTIPWNAACQTSLSFTVFRSLLKLMSTELVMPSKHFILCRPLFLLPSIFPSIRDFFSESVLCIGWPKYWSFSFSISSSDEYSGLISFRIAWIDLLNVQGTLKSILQHPSFKASILWGSAFFKVQLSHPKINLKNTWFWFHCLYDCWFFFLCVCVCVCVRNCSDDTTSIL